MKKEICTRAVLMVLFVAFVAVAFTSVSVVDAHAATVTKFTSNGSAYLVETGHRPAYVKCRNLADGSAIEWFAGMANAAGIKVTASAIENTSIAVITVNGITPYAGVVNATTGKVSNSPGFTLGADATVNNSGDDIACIEY